MAPAAEGSEAQGAVKTNVIIGNLKRDVDKEALKALLRQLGHVTNFNLQQPPGSDPASPATGIVEYGSAEDAARVVSHVHGKLILGRPVTAWVAASSGVPGPGASAPPLSQGAPAPKPSSSGTVTAGPARATYPGEMGDRNTNVNPEKNGARRAPAAGRMKSQDDPRWERPAAAAPSSGTATAGPARATYPGEMGDRNTNPNMEKNGVRRAPAAGQMNSHEDPRWERPTAPQQVQRVAERGPPPPGTYAEAYPHNSRQQQQRQQQQQQPWHAGRPTPQQQGGVNAAGAPRFRGETDQARYAGQWEDQGHEEDEAGRWERPERNQYPPAHRAPVRREHPAAYDHPQDSQTSGWYDETDSRNAPAYAAYGDGGQLRAPPGRPMMPRDASGSSARVLPRGSDDGYGDEEIPKGSRYRRRPPYNVAPAGRAASWTGGAEYTVPPPISIKGEDFEKEVVKAAALLVAEREMKAREEARKQGDKEQNEPPPGYDDHKQRKRSDRSAGEDADKRKKRESSSRSSDRPSQKRTRRDKSPHGNGRAENRDDDRRSSNSKRGEGLKSKPKRREDSRGRHEADDRGRGSSRGRHKDKAHDRRSNSVARDRERGSSKTRSSKPGPSGWDRSGGAGSPRNMREPSTADTGFYVHVGGLSFSTTFTTLAKRFAAFGDVSGFKVIFNKVSCTAGTGNRKGSKEETAAVVTASSGFAFISFENERGMEKAVECMDGQKLDGHILKVTRGGSKLDHSLKAYRPQPAPTSSNQRAPRRWPEPKGRNEYEQQKQQPHQPQSRPERGVRRQAPVSSSGSVAASTAAKQATQSSHRDASPDPLGALRSPRPSAASYKDTPASAKPDVNGRLIIGYGGKTNYRDSSSRDTAGGKANGAGVRRTEKYPATRPTNTARPGFQTGGRRP